MDELKKYKIKKTNERLKEIKKILVSLDSGSVLDALYAIYNNKQDKEAMKPIFKDYFEKQLEDVKNQITAYERI